MAPTDVGALLPLFIAVPLIAAGLAAVAPWAVVRRTLGTVSYTHLTLPTTPYV